jgi:hypothetical protein
MTPAIPRLLAHRIGIAIGPDRMWAVGTGGRVLSFGRPDGGELRVRELDPLGATAEWPDLADALRELRDAVGADAGAIAVSLLPPLVRMRRLELPPLTDEETRRIIERSAGRYFTGVREPQTVGVVRLTHQLRRTGVVVAAAAPARLVNAILDAAHVAGWSVGSIAPAHAAWAAGARAQWSQLSRESAQLAVLREDATELIRIERGVIAASRQFAGGSATRLDPLVEAVADPGDGAGPMPLLTIGPDDRRNALVAPLSDRGIVLGERPARWRAMAESPEAMAAAFAGDARGFDLLPQSAHAVRDHRTRRTAAWLMAAAVLLFIVGAGARLWDAKRELAAIEVKRAEIHDAVGEVIAARGMIDGIQRRIMALAPLEADATHWSVILAEVAARLPRDAFLDNVRGASDTLLVEGLAGRAASTFAALERAPSIRSVQPAGAIRRELTADGVPVERFSIAARLTGPDSAGAPVKRPR